MSNDVVEGHAFISYVHEDSEQVDALESFLEAAGIRVWRDKNELWPGDEWKIEIRRAIQRGALAFIACFSETSTAKERSHQNEELVLATEEYRLRRPGRPWLFPVRFDNVELPAYDLGAGKTLDALQRTDLFGQTREPNLGRLAMSVSRVISQDAGDALRAPTPAPAAALQPADPKPALAASDQLKTLLRDPTRDIDLDDYFTELADETRRACLSPVEFPTTSDDLRRGSAAAARLVIERCDRYWDLTRQFCEAMALACAWGQRDHDALLARSMKVIGNTTPLEGGQQVLLDLRAYPRIAALYAGTLGALARDNFGAVRAIAVDAKHRGQGETVPLIGVCNIWMPFSSESWLASAVARHTDGEPATDAEIDGFTKNSGKRKTPASDDLHARLRPLLRRVLPDDDDYDELFDRAEVLLGTIAQDVSTTERAAGRYAHNGWVGRYVWRSHSLRNMLDVVQAEMQTAGSAWPPLTAGLYGGELRRAEQAFETMSGEAHSHRFW